MSIFSAVEFAGVLAGFILLRWAVISFLRKTTSELSGLKQELLETTYQQQVIYNVSTTIFLLRDAWEIVHSTISEITKMYHWSNVAYFSYKSRHLWGDFYSQPPKHQRDEVFAAFKGETECADLVSRQGQYASIFLVGHPNDPVGALYAGKEGSALTKDQIAFFKTIANLLTLAFDNIVFHILFSNKR